jgi:hypothetical protein
MDDTSDLLEEGRTDVGCCEPLAVRDVDNLPDAGTAPLELTGDRISHPRRKRSEEKAQTNPSVIRKLSRPIIAASRFTVIQGETQAYRVSTANRVALVCQDHLWPQTPVGFTSSHCRAPPVRKDLMVRKQKNPALP